MAKSKNIAAEICAKTGNSLWKVALVLNSTREEGNIDKERAELLTTFMNNVMYLAVRPDVNEDKLYESIEMLRDIAGSDMAVTDSFVSMLTLMSVNLLKLSDERYWEDNSDKADISTEMMNELEKLMAEAARKKENDNG